MNQSNVSDTTYFELLVKNRRRSCVSDEFYLDLYSRSERNEDMNNFELVKIHVQRSELM